MEVLGTCTVLHDLRSSARRIRGGQAAGRVPIAQLHDADVGDDERGVERGRKPHPLQENTQTHASTAQNLHISQLPRPEGVHLPGS